MSLDSKRPAIFDAISDFFGCDPAYYDVDGWALADCIIAKLKSEKGIECHYVASGDFTFEYGIVVYKHRFSINRSLDDYQETTLSRCIRMGIEYKYKTMAKDKLVAELQIVYKDDSENLHCLCLDLHDYTFEIVHKGNMRIQL